MRDEDIRLGRVQELTRSLKGPAEGQPVCAPVSKQSRSERVDCVRSIWDERAASFLTHI